MLKEVSLKDWLELPSADGGFYNLIQRSVYRPSCRVLITEPERNRAVSQISNRLFLGDLEAASSKKLLNNLKIRRVISILDKEDMPVLPSHIRHMKIDLDDAGWERIDQYFLKTFQWIREAHLQKEHVLVHCMAGVSRSATIFIAYLMRRYRWPFAIAFDYVQQQRSIVCPNPGFQKQLKLLEQRLWYTKKRKRKVMSILTITFIGFDEVAIGVRDYLW